MAIRKEVLKNKGEYDIFTHYPGHGYGYRVSLRGTDEEDVYELYKFLFHERKDEVIVKGSLRECIRKANELAREEYPDWEDDTIAEEDDSKLEKIRRKYQDKK